jgi:hypothetical protein
MASLISWDHRCTACDHITTYLHDRANVLEVVPCEACGEPAQRFFSAANITKASYVDGTRRFDSIRERRKLEREARVAKRRGMKDEVAKLKSELAKQQGTKQ